MTKGDRILVVDDEENMVHFLSQLLSEQGYEVGSADSGLAALEKMKEASFDLVICDIRMPSPGGMEVLKAVKESGSTTNLVMITAYGTIPSAVEAMKAGAYDYLVKPFRANDILKVVEKAMEQARLTREVQYLRTEVAKKYKFQDLIGKSKRMQEVYQQIEKVATSRGTVLIFGESGTGKELVARAIHYNSPRRNRPFLAIDCAAVPETLQESEFFGHLKGSFTGAIHTKKGLLEEANGGTLFLDEVGELSPSMQAKLLRALQEGEVRRVGDTKTIKLDVRIIAATNKPLQEEVSQKRFRADLFYRLSVFPIQLPPLRERKEDIPFLASHFLEKFAQELGKEAKGFTPGAMERLMRYPWPGNVRELENVVERSLLMSNSSVIDELFLPVEMLSDGSTPQLSQGLKQALGQVSRQAERKLIEEALAKASHNRTRAARLLGISRRALLYKIKGLGIIDK